MNTNITLKRIQALILILLVLTSFINCSSRENETVTTSKENSVTEGTLLTFNVSGIEEPSPPVMLNASLNQTKGKKLNTETNLASEKMVSTSGFDVLTSAGKQSAIYHSPQETASINHTNIITTSAATAPVAQGIQYRILIYDSTGNQLISNTLATSGINPQIKVDAGKTYKWYVFSINNNSVPNINSAGVVPASALINKDVLYSQGIINAQYGQNYLNVVFKHATTSIDVIVDTRGLFGTINNTSVEVGSGAGFTPIIQTGDLNISTGQFSNLQSTPAVTNLKISTTAGGSYGATKIATFYTVKTTSIPANTLRVRFNQLDIQMDDTATQTTTRSFGSSTIPYNNIAITPAPGDRYTISARLIESAINVKGKLWARTNLYYTNGLDSYQFHSDNVYNSTSYPNTDYWNWKASNPTGSYDNTDQCQRVYPQGTWRLPTSSEFQSLGTPDTQQDNLGFFFGASVVSSWSAIDNSTAYPTNSKDFFAIFNGYRSTSGIISDSATGFALGFVASGSFYFWTSDGVSSSNANYFTQNYSKLFWLLGGFGDPQIQSGDKKEGRNIRCIRASSIPNT
ncbi:hypothetical protein [Elizabethkingia ursingii]|uniref:hypothetical protein n=1 Tax=Elizabethkingia ursingii TaxID=1756150 RepID=UPI002011FCAF|nr:hypothetical protein [Elizabethkingia ursingii]MCL1671524.1 hypothetical protein [Elizabethkingia ursingii]